MRERVLVCGGSGGIGSATCAALARHGYEPIVGYARARAQAEEIARRCTGEALALDFCDDAQIAAALAHLREAPLAGVVLAASAPFALESIAKLGRAELELHWRIQVLGPQQLLAGLIREVFRREKRGVVVGVLSRAMGQESGRSAPLMGGYAIAKYGLQGLLAALRADHPWLGVRAVSPGFTETRLLDAFDARFLERLRAEERFATPDEVAEDIVRALRAPAGCAP